jgi:hypothetical protein
VFSSSDDDSSKASCKLLAALSKVTFISAEVSRGLRMELVANEPLITLDMRKEKSERLWALDGVTDGGGW